MKAEDLETYDFDAKIIVTLHKYCMQDREGYKTKIRPNHWIPGRDYAFAGQLEFVDRELLRPGESCYAIGQFIAATQDKYLFVPGFKWHICEANKIVGYGEIVELLDS